MSKHIKYIQNKLSVPQTGRLDGPTAKAWMHWAQLSVVEATHMIAQCMHESAYLTRMVESMHYSSADRIIAVWPSRFRNNRDLAESLVANPVELGNTVYNGRMGNIEGTNDGFDFRGRGPLMLTGHTNYQAFSDYINDDRVMKMPEMLADYYALESVLWYFEVNQVWKYAVDLSENSLLDVSEMVNFGRVRHGMKTEDRQKSVVGFKHRQKCFNAAQLLLS